MKQSDSIFSLASDLTPRQIVNELDKYIIGQEDAKKSVAIALRNRSRRKMLDPDMQEEIAPKNIIMIGSTGVGKTEIARRLSRLVNAPFMKVEITKYTEVGYVGRDVESVIRDLVSISVAMVKKEYSALVGQKARRNAEQRILDLLFPQKAFDFNEMERSEIDITGKEEAELNHDEEREAEQKREVRLKKLQKGVFDNREIEYESSTASAIPVMSIMGGSGMEDIDIQIQNMLGELMPKKQRRKKISIAEARKLFEEEETEKLIDMEKVTKEAVQRTEEMGIVFIDEIDKIAGSDSKSGPDVSRHGVQRDLLPIIEGTTVVTKYGTVSTNHILFIAAGAFNVSKPSDLIPEIQGRFPIRVELNSLTEDDFKRILTVPMNSLTRQYSALLMTEGVNLSFTDDAISEIARTASLLNHEHENIGARRLQTVLEKLLENILFDAPDLPEDDKTISIDAGYVRSKLESTLKDRNLSKYIL